ncbi:hypothetical protein PFICI_07244 [Pestalotiopsis fici W106-1]|uniref:Uncharacterized protein n=1 Tax=Pestalotiopsis fici (strain W106-1 / CGMCC3.15140) TaxID=1229662 RepID=W3XA31_PESFW|nr:uncharacterized protein PFICI_07244 [Pestalotiopsis fici W106-1]ETS82242.1 hypothetical protein PFICI_07244 [Pestalotiopsis fici W106-1]
MEQSGENIELSEASPRSSSSEAWHDARDAQESPIETRALNDHLPNLQKLWCHMMKCNKPAMSAVSILTICGFPLLILGTWAAIAAIRVALWTQWKDSIEWCEKHNWNYTGCDSLEGNPLTLPSSPPTTKRFVTALRNEKESCNFLGGIGIAAMSVIGSTLYLLVVIVLVLVRVPCQGRNDSSNVRIQNSSGVQHDKTIDESAAMTRIKSLEDELASWRAEAVKAKMEHDDLSIQLEIAAISLFGGKEKMYEEVADRFRDRLRELEAELQYEKARNDVRDLVEQTSVFVGSRAGNDLDSHRDGISRDLSAHNEGIRKRLVVMKSMNNVQ